MAGADDLSLTAVCSARSVCGVRPVVRFGDWLLATLHRLSDWYTRVSVINSLDFPSAHAILPQLSLGHNARYDPSNLDDAFSIVPLRIIGWVCASGKLRADTLNAGSLMTPLFQRQLLNFLLDRHHVPNSCFAEVYENDLGFVEGNPGGSTFLKTRSASARASTLGYSPRASS